MFIIRVDHTSVWVDHLFESLSSKWYSLCLYTTSSPRGTGNGWVKNKWVTKYRKLKKRFPLLCWLVVCWNPHLRFNYASDMGCLISSAKGTFSRWITNKWVGKWWVKKMRFFFCFVLLLFFCFVFCFRQLQHHGGRGNCPLKGFKDRKNKEIWGIFMQHEILFKNTYQVTPRVLEWVGQKPNQGIWKFDSYVSCTPVTILL